jgi:hypothetical protein
MPYVKFTQDSKLTKLIVVPGSRIERAFLEEFFKRGTVRVTKKLNEESQPIFSFQNGEDKE